MTLSTWNTGFTWNTWWTHWTHWSFLLFTLAFASSGSAFLGWGFAGTLVVDFGQTLGVVVVFVFSANSVSGGDVSLKEVEVWAAREASLLFSTFWGDGVDHDVDLVLSEVEGSFLDGSERFLLDNTGVGHDHENSSSVFVVAVSEVVEHTENGVETFGDVVTMSHVLSIGDSFENVSFLADIFETRNDDGFGGVSNNTDSNSALVFSVKIFNHSGGSDFHFWPVSFDTGGGVQKDDNFNWARYLWDGGNITAASAGTFGQVHATGRSDRPDLVVSVLLGCHLCHLRLHVFGQLRRICWLNPSRLRAAPCYLPGMIGDSHGVSALIFNPRKLLELDLRLLVFRKVREFDLLLSPAFTTLATPSLATPLAVTFATTHCLHHKVKRIRHPHHG